MLDTIIATKTGIQNFDIVSDMDLTKYEGIFSTRAERSSFHGI